MTLPRYVLSANDIDFLLTNEEHDLLVYVISVRGAGWVQELFDSWIAARRRQLEESRRAELLTAFEGASAQNQATINGLLGTDL